MDYIDNLKKIGQNYVDAGREVPVMFENKDNTFANAMAKSKLLIGSANDIYYGAKDENGNPADPRSEAYKDLLADSFAELYKSNNRDYFKANYKNIMKSATGYDLDASSAWEIFTSKVGEGLHNNFTVAIPAYMEMLDYALGGHTDAEKELIEKSIDKRLQEGLKYRRTDYYKEFDGFTNDLLTATASFLPSVLPSVGIHLAGAALSGITGGLSSAIAIGASALWSSISEASNLALELRQQGANIGTIAGFASAYGVVAGIIEAKAGDIMQNKVLSGLKKAGMLHSSTIKMFDNNFVANTAREAIARAGGSYALSFITEPTEEMLQDFFSSIFTNMANAYQSKYGKPFTDQKSFQEMIDSAVAVGKETFTGNILLGLSQNAISFGASEAYGELAQIRNARKLAGLEKGQSISEKTEIASTAQFVIDRNTKSAKPDKNGAIGEIEAYKTETGSIIPATKEDMAKARYAQENGGYNKNGSPKNKGVYVKILDNVSDEGLENMSEKETAFSAFRTGFYDIDAKVKDNEVIVQDKYFNSALTNIINNNREQFGGVVASDENSVTLKIGGKTMKVVRENNGNSNASPVLSYFETMPDELKTQYENYKNTIIEKEDLKNYEPTLEKAINAGKEEFRTGNKEFAQKINKDIADTLVKGGMKSKRAQIIANGSTVVATRLANSLGISLEDFLGKYELTEQYREYTKDGSGYTVLPTEYTKTVDGKSETHTIRGHVDFANHILALTDKADATTVVHEIGHIFLGRVGDYRNIKGFAENYREALIKDNTDKKGVLADEKNWKIGKETQEAFAEDFERYIASGEVANEGLRKIFEQLKKAILAIRTLFDEVLTDDKKRMFDELLGVETVTDAIAEEEGLYESEDIRATEINTPQELTSNLKKQNDGTYLLSEDVEYPSDYVISPRQLLYAYHGSGVSFDEFMEKYVGNANGTTFGWGLYFSMSHLIAKDYAKSSGFTEETTDKHIEALEKTILPNIYSYGERIKGFLKEIDNLVSEGASVSEETIKELEEMISSDPDLLPENIMVHGEEGDLEIKNRLLELVEGLKNDEFYGVIELEDYLKGQVDDNKESRIEKELYLRQLQGVKESGDFIDSYNLYKIRIPAGKYLDWDTTFSAEVANLVRSELIGRGYSREAKEFEYWDEDTDPTFGEVYDYLSSFMSKREVSKMFESLGYKGIVYDAGQIWGLGGAEKGTKNIVLFNQDYANENIVNHWKYTDISEEYRLASEDVTIRDSNIHNLEDRLTQVLTQGGFLSREEIDALQDASATYKALSKALGVDKDLIELTADDLVKTEDFIIALYHDKPELIDKAEEAIQTIAKRRKLTTEEFTNEDWKDAGSIWNKSLKDEIHDDERVRKLLSWTMKRINDYINMDNAEADRQAWLNTFRDTQRGRTALNQFVKDLYNKTDYIKGGAIETGDMSMGERFPNLAMLANTLNRGNVAVSESLRERARKEIADNVGFFRDAYLRMNGMSAKADLEMSQNTASETISKNEQRYDFSKWIMDRKLPKEIRKAIDSKKYTKEVADYMIRQFKEEMALNERRNAEIQTLKERIKRRDGDIEELKQKIRDIRAEQKKVVLRLKEESRLQVVYEQMRRSIDAVKTRIKNTARSAGDVKSKHALTRIYNVLSKRQSMGYSLFNDFYTREYFEENASSTFNFLLDNGLIDDNGVVQKGLNRFAVPRFETEIKQNGSVISFFDTYTKEHVDGMLQAFRADAVEKQQQKAYESQKRKNETLKVSNKASSELGEITDLEEKIDRRIADLKAQEGYDEVRSGRLAKRMELLKQQHENDGDDSYTDADAERDANSILDEMERDDAENFVRTQEQSITKGSRTEEEKNSGVGNMGKKLFNFIHNPRILIKRISPTLHDVIFGFGGKGRKQVTVYNLDGTKQEYDGNYGLNQYENYTWRNADARIDETNRRLAEVFNINETDPRKLTKKVRESLIKKFLKNNGTITALTGNELEDALGRFCDEGQLRTFGYTVENGVVIKDHDTSYDSIGETTDEFTIEDLIGIYIRTKNKEGMSHLVGGNRISLGQIMAVRKMFEESDEYSEARQVADIINEEVGKRFDAIADIAYRLKNVELHKIPFYYPNISAERQVVFDVASSEFQKTHKLTDYFIFEQLGGDTAVDLNVLSGMEFAIIAQEKYIAGAEMFENFDELLNGEGKLLSKIEATQGKQSRKMIEDFISINKSRVRSDLDEVGKALGFLRSNMAIAKLGFNFSSILQQWASIPLMLSRYNIGEIVSSLIRMIKGGRAYADQFIYGVSPQMKRRNSYDVGVAKDINAYKSKFSALRAKIGEAGMYVMEKCDHFMADWMFDVAYQHNLAQGMDAEQAEIDAVQWVMDTQSNSSPKNNPLLYSTSNDLVKTIMLFTNQLNKQYNMLAGAVMEGGLKNIFRNVLAVGLSVMAVSLLTGKPLPEDDNDDVLKKFLIGCEAELMGMVPILGSTAKGIVEGSAFTGTNIVIVDQAQKAGKLIQALREDDAKKRAQKTKTAMKNLLYSAEDLFALPSVATKRFVQGWELMKDGKGIGSLPMSQLGTEYRKYWESR